MKLFGRKGRDETAQPRAAHRLMLDLEKARILAAMIAKSRASDVIEVSDLLAGMYISNWDRLSRYWEAEKQDSVEDFLRRMCQISPQRWNAWIEHYDAKLKKTSPSNWLAPLKKEDPAEKTPKASVTLAAVMKEAESISPFRDKLSEGQIPILTTECVLLCMAKNPGSEIARKLLASGLDSERLERDAKSVKPGRSI